MFGSCVKKPKQITPIMLLCHGNKHSYNNLLTSLSTESKKFTTMDLHKCPDFKVDITKDITMKHSLYEQFDMIMSVYCPVDIYVSDDGRLNKQTLYNIYRMLRPNGYYIFQMPTPFSSHTLDLTDEYFEKYDIPYGYTFVDVNAILTDPVLTKYFDVKYVYQHEVSSGSPFEGYIYTTPEERFQKASSDPRIPKNVEDKCTQHGINIQKWHILNDKALIVLQRKNTHSPVEGGASKVYTGPRGGKYVVMNGKRKYLK